jgi:hypothetical protein
VKPQERIDDVESVDAACRVKGVSTTFLFQSVDYQSTAILRHRNINCFLARKICRDLGIPEP